MDLRTGQVAERARLSRSTIRRAVWREELRARQTPNGHLRFNPDDVDKWISSMEIKRGNEG